jgi:hypothetical protein
METIKVDPIEELLKAIGIVHGPAAERRWRLALSQLEAESQRALNKVPWTAERIQWVLDNEVKYKDWRFVVQEREVAVRNEPPLSWQIGDVTKDTDLRVRAEWRAPDTMNGGEPELQQSRWWPLSKHMVKTEIIQTAFLCVLKAEEHETRETFKYKGKAPFHTHIDIDTLAAASDDIDVRTDPRPDAPANQRRE